MVFIDDETAKTPFGIDHGADSRLVVDAHHHSHLRFCRQIPLQ